MDFSYIYNASTKKMLPNEKKRMTTSARARISVKTTKKGKFSNLDGSYLERASGRNTVSIVNTLQQPGNPALSNNDAVMLMLQEIRE